ncbi:MAG: DNA-binding protein WhiA [Synergistaceae bacterium]|jgi:hypothetical protein|nr:DNA-binding protein WhiA [Synergistaceae bacterium]
MSSLAAAMWDEWSALPIESERAASFEIAGVLSCAPVRERDGAALVGGSRLFVVRRLSRLWRASRIDSGNQLNFHVPASDGRVSVSVPPDLREELGGYPVNWDWLRGAWGVTGSLYVPKAGYCAAMRIRRTAPRVAAFLDMSAIRYGSRPARSGDATEILIRDQQDIVTFLNGMGLASSALMLEDRAVIRVARAQANRARNCDTANIGKSVEAAQAQTDLAERLRDAGLLPSLPAKLRELAALRLERPSATLSELGRLLSPPVTKGTVNYRWKSIKNWAQRQGQPAPS